MIDPLPTACPFCGRVNDMHETVNAKAPESGDLSICWRCHLVATFDDDLCLRKMDPDELSQALNDSEVRMMLAAMHQAKAFGVGPSDMTRQLRRHD